MLRPLLFLIICLLCSGNLVSKNKENFHINLIPDSLKRNASAVIRHYNIDYKYKTPVSATEKKSVAITILDNNGRDFANFFERGDKFRKLTSFSGRIYNSKGEKIHTFKKNDIKTSAFSQHLSSDDFTYYLTCTHPAVPFTIHYEYEMEWKNGIIIFPVFSPQKTFNISVIEAKYTLSYPSTTDIHTRIFNQVEEHTQEEQKGVTIRKWTVKNLSAKKYERYAPAFDMQNPKVYACPREFVYEKTKGTLTSAVDICTWQNVLNKDRNTLSTETKNTITELVKDATTDKEKVRILYEYLGSITRYESIQLGIGGFQPIPAAEVCRTGFGDCKGLSNLLKAMLNHVNIPANYVIIRMSKHEKDLDDDFTAFIRTNHVILQVPLPEDTVWLECTNTRLPFGYIHNQIAGHNALVTTDNGGYMSRLPDYPDSLNLEHNAMQIKLNEDGSAHVQVEKNWHVKTYDNVFHFLSSRTSEVTDYLRKEITLPNVDVSAAKLENNKSSLPSLSATYEWTTPLYGSKTTNRLLIPVNAMRYTITPLKKGQRDNDIQIIIGWKDTDQITLEVPDGYEIESLPAPVIHTCEFGNFSSSINIAGNQISINQSVFVKTGQYDVSLYPYFVDFFEKITEMYKSRIILRKMNRCFPN